MKRKTKQKKKQKREYNFINTLKMKKSISNWVISASDMSI